MTITQEAKDGLELRSWYKDFGILKRSKNVSFISTEQVVSSLDGLYESPETGWQLLFDIIEEMFFDELSPESLSLYVTNHMQLIEEYLEYDTDDEV
jgi:hypothetical protein